MIRKGIFFNLGIPTSERSVEELDAKIVQIVGMSGKPCDKIWKKVNKWLEDENRKEVFRTKLSKSLSLEKPISSL